MSMKMSFRSQTRRKLLRLFNSVSWRSNDVKPRLFIMKRFLMFCTIRQTRRWGSRRQDHSPSAMIATSLLEQSGPVTEIEIWKIRMNMQRERVKWNLSVVADTFLLKQIIKYYDVSNWNSSTKHVNMNISIYISTLQDPVLLIRASC